MKHHVHFDHRKLQTLCDDFIDGCITSPELEELEDLVLRFPEARSVYIEYMTHHAVMAEYFGTVPTDDMEKTLSVSTDLMLSDMPTAQNFCPCSVEVIEKKQNRFSVKGILSLSVLSVVLALVGFLSYRSLERFPEKTPGVKQDLAVETFPQIPSATEEAPSTFGIFTSLHDNADPRWSNDSDAIGLDGQVGQGRLHLLDGAGLLRYDHGAVLIIKAPARLTLYSRDRCFLHSGRVFARVSPEAIGFTVETEVAAIKDLGTEFGVSVGEGRDADVQVFSGRVDVMQKNGTDVIPITTGGWLRFKESLSRPHEPLLTVNPFHDTPSEEEIVCSTAGPNGREACILSGGDIGKLGAELISHSHVFTLIKHSIDGDAPWHRKAYFSIGLSELSESDFRDVQLELSFAPTGVGFLAYTPEVSTFSIYGLLEESEDHWDEKTITWDNAPANLPGGSEVDQDKVVKIASFNISHEQEACRIVVSNPALRTFLSRDTDHVATFIVVRDTPEIFHSGYAHGFANRHHPELPPPTLRFFK